MHANNGGPLLKLHIVKYPGWLVPFPLESRPYSDASGPRLIIYILAERFRAAPSGKFVLRRAEDGAKICRLTLAA